MPTPKRFIAGAVCPRCAEMDKLTMYPDDNETQHRECVSCGFTDTQGDRVNKRKNEDDHTVKQVVFFKAGSSDE